MTLSNLTATGTINAQKLTVNNQYYSTGGSAGYNFADRSKGDQWAWYADNGTTRLWTDKGGGDKLSIDQSGNLNLNGGITVDSLTVGGSQWRPSPHQIQSVKQKAANKCLSASGDLKLTVNETCNSNDINQFWYWMGHNLVNAGKNLCVEMPSDNVATKIKLVKCDPNATGQVLYKQRGGYGMNGIASENYGGQLFFNPNDQYAQIADGWSCNTNNNTSWVDGHAFCKLYYGKPS